MTPQASPRHFLLSLVTLCACALGSVSGLAQSPPNLTHVDNVNNAGNATLYWDVFEQQGTEEFVQNEIKVFDLDQNPLGTQWHIISSEIINGNLVLPTGWVMPSFLYDANQLAHCYIGVQITVDNGLQSVSDSSPFLCSIHVSIDEGRRRGRSIWSGTARMRCPARPRAEISKSNDSANSPKTGNWSTRNRIPPWAAPTPTTLDRARKCSSTASVSWPPTGRTCTRATVRIWSSAWPGARLQRSATWTSITDLRTSTGTLSRSLKRSVTSCTSVSTQAAARLWRTWRTPTRLTC